jgi:hypothetical protein
LFNRAKDKVFKQLDIVNILRWIEQLKLLTKVMLNHKQKFWLKFQKEHVLEVDYNSQEERTRKKKEIKDDNKDLIKGIQKNDKNAIEKVKKMLKYLQHGNRTSFDLKIIQGLFEEYVSDSDEEIKVNRAMDTEEERKEFYSLALPVHDEVKKKNPMEITKPGMNNMFDLSSLHKLYNNDEGLVSIGRASASNTPSPAKKRYATKKSMRQSNTSPLTELTSKSTKKKRTKPRVGWEDRAESKKSNQLSDNAQRIQESEEEEYEDSGRKEKIDNYRNDEDGSIIDIEGEDFISNVENKLNEGPTQVV